MSIRTTDETHVALFDSTTMEAFGPVFESADHADDFIAWVAERASHAMRLSTDNRAVVDRLHSKWQAARCDDDGNLLPA